MIDLVKVRGGANYVVLGRRRIGKTAVIERIYNDLWNSQKEIVPLCFSFVGRLGKNYLDTLRCMAEDFISQYIRFRGLIDAHHLERLEYHDFLDMADDFNDDGIRNALIRCRTAEGGGNPVAISRALTTIPRTIADTNDTSIVVFLDEFQTIIQMKDDKGNYVDLRGDFQPAVESPRCDFYVTGSAVTMIHERILHEGPLLGRFDVLYIKPLPEYYGLELCDRLASKYGLKLSEKQKSMLVEYCGSHPYYIKCFMRKLKALSTTDEVTDPALIEAITGELTGGEIRNFIEEYIQGVEGKYGREIRKLLTYIADKEGPISPEILEDSAEDLKRYGIARYSTYEDFYDIIKDLSMADFIERNSVFTNYYLLDDPVLKRYLHLQYEWEIRKRPIMDVQQEEIENLRKRVMELKSIMGFLFESHIKYLMSLLDNKTVEGRLFNTDRRVKLPKFRLIYSTSVKPPRGQRYEIDIFAYPSDFNDPSWVVECRYRNRRANATDIKKFASVLDAVKKEKKVSAVQGWFISVEGLSGNAKEHARELGIYVSGKTEVNRLLRRYGVRPIRV